MTAITSPTEVSTSDIPMELKSGTAKRRKLVYIRATSEGTVDTLQVDSFVPGVDNIEGVLWETKDGVQISRSNGNSTTPVTFSATAITTVAGAGVYEMGVVVSLA